ncbi:Oidioi.mRNA.OKI2018_I69.chr2.g4065.t1.cds [Oikopleura dioica]|uniref:Oidioi.mRNA.OKI2018_I69.chr2.g4065.t1.cds n=1 Tax=Oikopleura dioica TaxID=34765 RepID=A0ABN7SWN4_OIKDI|nr:Oidioi.mRNA.OKI2018_I69.chr2.g4065.t1.cds [Oikopleura dioica]
MKDFSQQVDLLKEDLFDDKPQNLPTDKSLNNADSFINQQEKDDYLFHIKKIPIESAIWMTRETINSRILDIFCCGGDLTYHTALIVWPFKYDYVSGSCQLTLLSKSANRPNFEKFEHELIKLDDLPTDNAEELNEV